MLKIFTQKSVGAVGVHDYFKYEYYPDIYALTPDYEYEPGWWKLKWKPLWRKTYSVWSRKNYTCCGPLWRSMALGFRTHEASAHNGWNRSYQSQTLEVFLLFWTVTFWIKWNYRVHKDGPSDVPHDKQYPLVLP